VLLVDIDTLLLSEQEVSGLSVPTLLVDRTERKRFMTMRGHLRLKRLVEAGQLIPLTDLEEESYKKIELFQIDAPPKWAIIGWGNGILKDGKHDKRYDNWLRQHDLPAGLGAAMTYLKEQLDFDSLIVHGSRIAASIGDLRFETVEETGELLLQVVYDRFKQDRS